MGGEERLSWHLRSRLELRVLLLLLTLAYTLLNCNAELQQCAAWNDDGHPVVAHHLHAHIHVL